MNAIGRMTPETREAATASASPMLRHMDAAAADALTEIAQDAHARLRRQEPESARPVEERYPEMLQALAWYIDAGQPDAAYRLASSLVSFWTSTNRIDEGDDWYRRALTIAAGSGPARARALYDHGYLIFWAGRYELAEKRFTESRTLAAAVGDRTVEALALAGLARVYLNTDVDRAVRLLREAATITDGADDADEGRSSALHVLGVALQMAGDLEAARDVMSARLALGRETGDEYIVWVESANLSMVERQLGNLDRAEALSRQALSIDAGRGDEMSIAWTLNGLAAVTAAKGDLERASTLHGMAAAMLERAGGEWPPDEREQHEQTFAALAAGLPQDVLDNTRAAGAQMSKESGVAYALAGAEGGQGDRRGDTMRNRP